MTFFRLGELPPNQTPIGLEPSGGHAIKISTSGAPLYWFRVSRGLPSLQITYLPPWWPPDGPKPIGVWLGGSPPKRKNVDIAAKWDTSSTGKEFSRMCLSSILVAQPTPKMLSSQSKPHSYKWALTITLKRWRNLRLIEMGQSALRLTFGLWIRKLSPKYLSFRRTFAVLLPSTIGAN